MIKTPAVFMFCPFTNHAVSAIVVRGDSLCPDCGGNHVRK